MVLLQSAGESGESFLYLSLQYIRKYGFLLKKNVSCKICQLHKLNSIHNVKFQVLGISFLKENRHLQSLLPDPYDKSAMEMHTCLRMYPLPLPTL
jgi:hypothetical protein